MAKEVMDRVAEFWIDDSEAWIWKFSFSTIFVQ